MKLVPSNQAIDNILKINSLSNRKGSSILVACLSSAPLPVLTLDFVDLSSFISGLRTSSVSVVDDLSSFSRMSILFSVVDKEVDLEVVDMVGVPKHYQIKVVHMGNEGSDHCKNLHDPLTCIFSAMFTAFITT